MMFCREDEGMAYSVLLVDDEEEAIRVIMDKIDWEGLGFTIAGHAGNGVLALEMAEECQPDVVMTDIKMPYMDGLELARRLKHEYPAVRILLCTGFDEFEYAKEAVHLEVEEYLLKPVNAQELTESFKRLRKSLDEERAEKQNVRKLQNYYMESLPLLQANFYSSLIDGRISKSDIPKYINDYQIDLTGPVLCCVDIHTSASEVPEGMSPLLLSMSVQLGFGSAGGNVTAPSFHVRAAGSAGKAREGLARAVFHLSYGYHYDRADGERGKTDRADRRLRPLCKNYAAARGSESHLRHRRRL